ncbi:hypothetical protein OFC05_30180, partial [Escherichia coli]|nr:hypothetical protein [Escherichia coli]
SSVETEADSVKTQGGGLQKWWLSLLLWSLQLQLLLETEEFQYSRPVEEDQPRPDFLGLQGFPLEDIPQLYQGC